MKKQVFNIKANLWIYPGENASWHFLTIPKKETLRINKEFGNLKRGWGSLPVEATIGETTWRTSIFPDTKTGTYLLPVKALVRRKEDIYSGDKTTVTLTICP